MRTVAAALATVFCLLPMLLSSGGWGVQAEYDPVRALRSVYYCKVSKCPPANISSWNCGESCTNFSGAVSDVTTIWSDSDQTQMFIAYNSVFNEIAIAFRGSTTLLNWLEDAEAWMTDYPWCTGCQVHTGFQTTYNQIAPNITAAVTALLAKYPSATIFLAGHSLGAAQARLCALDMQRRFGSTNRVVTYTIGTPRFANKALSAWAEAQLSRGEHYYITHDADPVPHLPPESWGYIHVPQEVWYKKGIDAQGYKVCNGTVDREDPTCADSLPLPINVEDHLVYLGVSTGCGADGDAMEKRELLRLVKTHVKEVADRSKQHANGRAHRRDAVARRLRLPKH